MNKGTIDIGCEEEEEEEGRGLESGLHSGLEAQVAYLLLTD